MPIYHYMCRQEGCEYEFETHQSIKADPLKECPECKYESLKRVIYAVPALVKGEPKTVAMLAERNTELLGRQGREEMWAKAELRKQEAKIAAREELAAKLPKGASLPSLPETSEKWYRPGTTGPIMSLANLTPQQAKNYAQEGTLP